MSLCSLNNKDCVIEIRCEMVLKLRFWSFTNFRLFSLSTICDRQELKFDRYNYSPLPLKNTCWGGGARTREWRNMECTVQRRRARQNTVINLAGTPSSLGKSLFEDKSEYLRNYPLKLPISVLISMRPNREQRVSTRCSRIQKTTEREAEDAGGETRSGEQGTQVLPGEAWICWI